MREGPFIMLIHPALAAADCRSCFRFRDSGGGAGAWARPGCHLHVRQAAFLPTAFHPAACAPDSGAAGAAFAHWGACPGAARQAFPAVRQVFPALYRPAALPPPACRPDSFRVRGDGGGDSARQACRPLPACPPHPASAKFPVRSAACSACQTHAAGQIHSPDRGR